VPRTADASRLGAAEIAEGVGHLLAVLTPEAGRVGQEQETIDALAPFLVRAHACSPLRTFFARAARRRPARRRASAAATFWPRGVSR